jgi:ketosteroid isomerase-like protein
MSANTRTVAERFMAALQGFEADGRVERLADLFADDAELSNLAHAERGRDGARRFWQQYRAAFGEILSAFRAVIVGEGGAALEWESDGTLSSGAPIRYRGVSLLEVDGDRVRRFRTYYDSAAFVTPAAAARSGS